MSERIPTEAEVIASNPVLANLQAAWDAAHPPPPGDEDNLVSLHGGRIEIRGVGPNSLSSIFLLLEEHRQLILGNAAPIRWNELRLRVEQDDAPLEVSRAVTIIRTNAEKRIHHETAKIDPMTGKPIYAMLRLGKENVADVLLAHAQANPFHPVRDYLGRLPDAPGAIQAVAQEAMGLAANDAILLRKWAISAVARAFVPGCKVDTVLILVGVQGMRKSSFFRALAGDWFSDTFMDLRNKDAFLQLHSAWIYEWSEMTSMKRADVESTKAFVSSQEDNFRAPYARENALHKRCGIIVGSTNSDQFLKDPTGERRWWPITLTSKIDTDIVANLRDQFWGEAVAAYNFGERWNLEDDDPIQTHLAARHATYRETDPWEDDIRAWLDKGPAGDITTTRIMLEALHLREARDRHRSAEMRVASVMREAGYRSVRISADGNRIRIWEEI